MAVEARPAKLLNSILTSKWTKAAVFAVCLIPLAMLLWRAKQGDLTANPIEFVEHWTGDWTIRFLVITLCITPLRKILHVPQLIRFRRMLGLFAFFYLCLHFSSWIVLDHFFNWREMWADVAKRPYITVGFTGFVLLVPLAVTSTAGWIRRLGGKRWQMLHRAVYFAAIAGVIHYYWLVKSDVRKPLEYAWMIGVLLVWRIAVWVRKTWLRGKTQGVPRRADLSARSPSSTETA